MPAGSALLFPFNASWEAFLKAWTGARKKASTKSIHQLRVNTRRLISTLDLMRPESQSGRIDKLQRQFKKVLKAMGPVRDVQVQLGSLSEIPQGDSLADFKQRLKRREKREIERINKTLKRGRKSKMEEQVDTVRSEFEEAGRTILVSRFRKSVRKILRLHRNEYLRARRGFDPRDDKTLHEMRIALKRLRYAVEAADPILGNAYKADEAEMRRFQKLLGDARDFAILRRELARWASPKAKRRKRIEPALKHLQDKRDRLLKQITRSTARPNRMLHGGTLPHVEKTVVAPGVGIIDDAAKGPQHAAPTPPGANRRQSQ